MASDWDFTFLWGFCDWLAFVVFFFYYFIILFYASWASAQVTTIAAVLQLWILAKSPTIQHPTKGCFLCGVTGEGNLAWKAKCCLNYKRKQNLYLLMVLRIIPAAEVWTPVYVCITHV